MRRLRFPRLHWFAWLGLLVSSVAMTILVVPGLPSDSEPKLKFKPRKVAGGLGWTRPHPVREFEHGWPLTFMRRALGYSATSNLWRTPPPFKPTKNIALLVPKYDWGGLSIGNHDIEWTTADAWSLTDSDVYEFYLWPAVIDGAMLLVAIAIVTIGCQRWIRRRGAVWRWRLIDFAAVFTLTAVVLGTWREYAGAHRRDALVVPYPYPLTKADASKIHSLTSHDWEYCGPLWLARLVGGREPLRCFDRVVSANLREVPVDRTWEEIGRLTEVEQLVIGRRAITEAEFKELASLPKLKKLLWFEPPAEAVHWIPRLKTIESVYLFECLSLPQTDEQLREAMPGVDIRVKYKMSFFEPHA